METKRQKNDGRIIENVNSDGKFNVKVTQILPDKG